MKKKVCRCYIYHLHGNSKPDSSVIMRIERLITVENYRNENNIFRGFKHRPNGCIIFAKMQTQQISSRSTKTTPKKNLAHIQPSWHVWLLTHIISCCLQTNKDKLTLCARWGREFSLIRRVDWRDQFTQPSHNTGRSLGRRSRILFYAQMKRLLRSDYSTRTLNELP